MRKHRKAPPNPTAFAQLPRSYTKHLIGYDASRSGPKKKTDLRKLLVASRVQSGRSLRGAEVGVGGPDSSRTVEVPPGWTWCSYVTLAEDITAATGASVSRTQARYAARQMKEGGTLRVEQTDTQRRANGRYGSLMKLSKDPTQTGGPSVDILLMARLFHFSDPADFKWAETLRTTEAGRVRRGKRKTGTGYLSHLPEGENKFISLGRWKSRGDVGTADADVFIPWIVFDLDRERNVARAMREAGEIARYCISLGIDRRYIYVGFSGHKGAHVHVSTGAWGFPVFTSAEAAKEVIGRVQEEIGKARVGPSSAEPVEYDGAVAGNPRTMIRVEGSQHTETGYRKTVWPAGEFLEKSDEDLRADIEEKGASRRRREAPEQMAEVESEVLSDLFATAEIEARAAVKKSRRAEARRARGGKRRRTRVAGEGKSPVFGSVGGSFGPVLKDIITGVGHHEPFEGGHSGRSRAAYILACNCYESAAKREEAARRLVLPEDETTENILLEWNRRCDPPMKEREVEGALKSAYKKVT